MTDQTNKDLLALKAVRDEIGQWISDPMWADHAELPKMTLKHWHHVLHAAISASAPAAGSVPSGLSIVELARFHAIDHEHWSPERIEAFAADVLAQYGSPAIPERLRAYIEYRRSHEMLGLGDVIHGVNGEAFLCLSDLFELLPPAPQEGK